MYFLLVSVIIRNELGFVNIKFVLNEGYSNFINIVKFFEVFGSSYYKSYFINNIEFWYDVNICNFLCYVWKSCRIDNVFNEI